MEKKRKALLLIEKLVEADGVVRLSTLRTVLGTWGLLPENERDLLKMITEKYALTTVVNGGEEEVLVVPKDEARARFLLERIKGTDKQATSREPSSTTSPPVPEPQGRSQGP